MSLPLPTGRARYYTLDEQRVPVPCFDLAEWARWCGEANHIVAQDTLGAWHGVSTVFLGVDMSIGMGRAPLLFETMLFIDGQAGPLVRSRTWDEASGIHERVCQLLRQALDKAAGGALPYPLARTIVETIETSRGQA